MTSAKARTLVPRAAKPPTILPSLRGMVDGGVLLRRVALAALCAGKSQTVAERRFKRVPEPFGPALARASHIC